MFQDLYDEIERMGLLAAAENVADAFIQSGEPHLHERTLEEAIKRGMAGDEPITHKRIMKKYNQLSDLGYIWQDNRPPGQDYEPGIPGLMSFVHRKTLT